MSPSWFDSLVEFEKVESFLIQIDGATVCPIDDDYATYKQWKLNLGEGCGRQAINVITAERYKEVTDQSIQYALGYWGKEAPAVMDLSVKDRILDRPRAKEWRNWSAPDLSLKEVRQKFGGPGVSDEDLVLRVIAGEAAVKAMLAAGSPKEYFSATQPLITLIGELAKRRDCGQIYIRKGELVLRMEKRHPPV